MHGHSVMEGASTDRHNDLHRLNSVISGARLFCNFHYFRIFFSSHIGNWGGSERPAMTLMGQNTGQKLPLPSHLQESQAQEGE